jgi:hypothetical protein
MVFVSKAAWMRPSASAREAVFLVVKEWPSDGTGSNRLRPLDSSLGALEDVGKEKR